MKKRSSDDLIDDLINEGRVKLHKFQPSGRELWTVVGNYGDHLIFIHGDYCSCRGFYFSLIRQNSSSCYHLKAYKIAKQQKKYSSIEISDSDYEIFLKLLTQSIKKQMQLN
tara:strand:+ start:2402 stop:2734 length:333 start_codon:yes stop_codon:yes gene_type:complete